MADKESSEWLSLLQSKKRLERERGLSLLKQLVEGGRLGGQEERDAREEQIFQLVSSLTCPWEAKHGGLMAAGVLLSQASGEFVERLQGEVLLLLEHDESRIRLATGELVGNLCRVKGAGVFGELEPYITAGIRDNLERDRVLLEQHPELMEKLTRSPSPSPASSPTTEEGGERPRSPSAAQIFHETAGWRHLETYMVALQHAVEGCGTAFEPYLTSDLLQLLFTSLQHTNRFVRETAFRVIAAIVQIPDLSPSTVATYWSDVAQHLAQGLADNWSQVRMASSVATRQFLTHLPSPEARETYLPTLLPAMCLNRYYVAEGVRLYSQETWKQVTQLKGVQLVEKYISEVVQFYISQSQAANHAVREAACTCIAELGTKVSPGCLRPHIPELVQVLLECFRDDSWLVRDAACMACGNFMASFPSECQPLLNELLPLFFANLEDSMPSVRQGAAASLATVVKVYGSEVEEKVFSVIKERLPLVADQPVTAELHPGLESKPAVFGVVKRVKEGLDDPSHTDQQMYSCGSLAPKMRRGGCMDTSFHKPAEPWEKSEGCIHLVAELSQQKPLIDKVSSLLPVVAEAARHKHYRQHLVLLETLLRRLPAIATGLGKRPFKRHLELFLDSIFYGASCDSALVKAAAADCLILLSQHLGHVILRGRIEQHNPQYVPVFDSIVPGSGPH